MVVAAHPDDEVLGCGGTLCLLAKGGVAVHILFLADGESSRISESANLARSELLIRRRAEAEEACRILGCQSVELIGLPDNRLDSVDLLTIVKHIEERIVQYKPKTVFTHHSGDVNIDHRCVHDAVIAACRPTPGHPVRELLFFETPSSTEWRPAGSSDAFNPNYFVDITSVRKFKQAALNAYQGEIRAFPHPRSSDAIDALMRWRGATVGVEAAEAFVLGRKLESEIPSI
ncbi:MAG: PIG-L family deacetylase [Syntrophaceae bacterium]|nr:PIG-L family deacetylase [Syntrophaceae bacterium]